MTFSFRRLSIMMAIIAANGCNYESSDLSPTEQSLPTGDVIAQVGEIEITKHHILSEMQQKGVSQDKASIDSFVNTLIDRNAAVIKIKELGLDQDPAFIAKYQKLALNTLRTKFQQQQKDHLSVTPEEVKAFYHQNVDQFTKPEMVRVSIIEIRNRHGSSISTTQDKLETVWGELKSSPNTSNHIFQKLAAKYSDHRASRYRGGDIGYLVNQDTPEWPDAFLKNVFEMKVGETAKIEANDERFFLAKLTDYKPAETLSLKSSTNKIERIIGLKKQESLHDIVSNNIREGIKIELNAAILESLETNDASQIKDTDIIPAPSLN